MLRKVAAFAYGILWIVLAFLIWPEGNLERPLGTMTMGDLLRVSGATGTAIVGVATCVLTWRA